MTFSPAVLGRALLQQLDVQSPGEEMCKEALYQKQGNLLVFSGPLSGRRQERISKDLYV